jgi:hypothetical protein
MDYDYDGADLNFQINIRLYLAPDPNDANTQ